MGKLYIVSAPSGAGKTSLLTAAVSSLDFLCLSVSHTTRPKRDNEIDGKNYHFVDDQVFQKLKSDAVFLETAQVFGYEYATSKIWVEQQLAKGLDVVLEIDWQGAEQIRKIFADVIGIFILPPDYTTLKTRLFNRKTDDATVIQKRLNEAITDIQQYRHFDYVIINSNFDQALTAIKSIFLSQRHTIQSQQQTIESLFKNFKS